MITQLCGDCRGSTVQQKYRYHCDLYIKNQNFHRWNFNTDTDSYYLKFRLPHFMSQSVMNVISEMNGSTPQNGHVSVHIDHLQNAAAAGYQHHDRSSHSPQSVIHSPHPRQDLTQSSGRETQTSLLLHTAAAFTLFSLVWSYTLGGYICSLPLFLYLFVYAYGLRQICSFGVLRLVYYNLKSNLYHWYRDERRSLILILMYLIVKVLLTLFYPQGEFSNGSPLSLILFTVFYIVIFIAPTVLQFIAFDCVLPGLCFLSNTNCVRKSKNIFTLSRPIERQERDSTAGTFTKPIRTTQSSNFAALVAALSNWQRSIFVILILVVVTYAIDGDITSILRYIGKGKPCWPLLIPQNLRDDLPYPLQHAWIKTWHETFEDYKPSRFIQELLFIGREMEVIHILPVVIGMYVLSQLFLPREYERTKKTFFGAVSGVVLSGVISGSLKLFFHRYRPNAYGNPYYWTGPSTAYVNHLKFSKLDLSFPAGHTTITSIVATCLYLAIRRTYQRLSKGTISWLIFCLYFYPMVVLVSRVSDCYHWTSDAVFGIFLGYVIAHVIMGKLQSDQVPKSNGTYYM